MLRTYKSAGVDIERGDRFVSFIQGMKSPAIPDNLGAFAGAVDLDWKRFQDPVLLNTCDGVGTKLLVAKKLNRYDTIGIDLVAMCANDLIVCGVKPLAFQDYIACGRITNKVLQPVMRGIVKGCELAECLLTGGETAELPDMYARDDFDLAGFCSGVGERTNLLPKKKSISEGDLVWGLPSSGIHSNGISLARKILQDEKELEEMLTPTKIYVHEMNPLIESGLVLAAAHVTGGGLIANLKRVIPRELAPSIDFNWPRPWIFDRIQECGEIAEDEMRKVYNLGIGIALVVSAATEDEFDSLLKARGITALRLGRLQGNRGEPGGTH